MHDAAKGKKSASRQRGRGVVYQLPLPNLDVPESLIPEGTYPPSIITISGPFSSGKDTLKDELKVQLVQNGVQIGNVIKYKTRPPRPWEIPNVNYVFITEYEFNELVQSGEIFADYLHDRKYRYGISRAILDVIKDRTVLLVIDPSGVVDLTTKLQSQGIETRILSFMLHASKNDILQRLVARSSQELPPEELEELLGHKDSVDDELRSYREHEGLFRHVLANSTSEGVPEERIRYLARRAMEILGLEARLNAPTAETFREIYISRIVQRLFGIPHENLVTTDLKDLQLKIPNYVIDAYVRSHSEISQDDVRMALSRFKPVFGIVNHGVLSVFFEGTHDAKHKGWVLDLIQETIGLTPQYKQITVQGSKESRYGLTKYGPDDPFLVDTYLSFSPYDPMKAPRPEARVHRLTIEGIIPILTQESVHGNYQNSNITPVALDRVKQLIEGTNGNH